MSLLLCVHSQRKCPWVFITCLFVKDFTRSSWSRSSDMRVTVSTNSAGDKWILNHKFCFFNLSFLHTSHPKDQKRNKCWHDIPNLGFPEPRVWYQFIMESRRTYPRTSISLGLTFVLKGGDAIVCRMNNAIINCCDMWLNELIFRYIEQNSPGWQKYDDLEGHVSVCDKQLPIQKFAIAIFPSSDKRWILNEIWYLIPFTKCQFVLSYFDLVDGFFTFGIQLFWIDYIKI